MNRRQFLETTVYSAAVMPLTRGLSNTIRNYGQQEPQQTAPAAESEAYKQKFLELVNYIKDSAKVDSNELRIFPLDSKKKGMVLNKSGVYAFATLTEMSDSKYELLISGFKSGSDTAPIMKAVCSTQSKDCSITQLKLPLNDKMTEYSKSDAQPSKEMTEAVTGNLEKIISALPK